MTGMTLRDTRAPRPEADNSLLWSDARLLGFGPMDRTHEEFYQVAFGLLTCNENSAPAALEAFERHAVAHFAQEEEWMRTSDFPPADCHMQEHAAILASLREVRIAVQAASASTDLVHDFALYLFQWFPGHADYLDSALAAWMSARTYGGKPVVIRRAGSRRS